MRSLARPVVVGVDAGVARQPPPPMERLRAEHRWPVVMVGGVAAVDEAPRQSPPRAGAVAEDSEVEARGSPNGIGRIRRPR